MKRWNKCLLQKASPGISVLEQCPRELAMVRNSFHEWVSLQYTGWMERVAHKFCCLALQPWLLQWLSMGCYFRWYNWAPLQAFIWYEWGTWSVPLILDFLWETWLADFKSKHVRAPGLCLGCKQPSQLHCMIRWLLAFSTPYLAFSTKHLAKQSFLHTLWCDILLHFSIPHQRDFHTVTALSSMEKQKPSTSRCKKSTKDFILLIFKSFVFMLPVNNCI